jgi:KaiC/GvpD/RAD55 family RecA-like ATPase
MDVPRVSTGIPNLDALLGGGFIKDSVNLVEGGPGSGKTTFALQYLLDGCRKGERCIFFTLDTSERHLLSFFSHLNISEKKFKIVDFRSNTEEFLTWVKTTKHTSKKKGIASLVESINLPKSLTSLSFWGEIKDPNLLTDIFLDKVLGNAKDADRIAIDSLSILDMLFLKPHQKRELITLLFRTLRELHVTSVLTIETIFEEGLFTPMDPQLLGGFFDPLEFLADSVLRLIYSRSEEQFERSLRILKARAIDHPTDLVKISITNEGLKVIEESHVPVENEFLKFLEGHAT